MPLITNWQDNFRAAVVPTTGGDTTISMQLINMDIPAYCPSIILTNKCRRKYKIASKKKAE